MDYKKGDRVIHCTQGPATVYQDREHYTNIHIKPDNEPALIVAVSERDVRPA